MRERLERILLQHAKELYSILNRRKQIYMDECLTLKRRSGGSQCRRNAALRIEDTLWTGSLQIQFAIEQPPGHHSEEGQLHQRECDHPALCQIEPLQRFRVEDP